MSPFKYTLPPAVPAEGREELRRKIGAHTGRKIIVAACPRERELASIFEVYSKFTADERPLLILGLRFPDLATKENYKGTFKVLNRDPSDQPLHKPFNGLAEGKQMGKADVILLNTAGELLTLMSIADAAIISEDRNIMEPLSQGTVPLYFEGAWVHNVTAIHHVRENNGGIPITDQECWNSKLFDALENPGGYKSRCAYAMEKFREDTIRAGSFIACLLIVGSLTPSRN